MILDGMRRLAVAIKRVERMNKQALLIYGEIQSDMSVVFVAVFLILCSIALLCQTYDKASKCRISRSHHVKIDVMFCVIE